MHPLLNLLIVIIVTLTLLWLIYPEVGLLSRMRKNEHLSTRVLNEDALKHLYQSELDEQTPSISSIAGTLNISQDQAADLITNLVAHQLVNLDKGTISLTHEGREVALHIIRAHRLWERYLADKTGYSQNEWHALADRAEHQISKEELNSLAQQLGHPTHDPHGDPIPTPSGEFNRQDTTALPQLSPGQSARIIHIEDEPAAVYAQLVAEGLHPGQEIRVIESSSDRVRFWSNGDEHLLAPLIANNVGVIPIQKTSPVLLPGTGLNTLKPGQKARIRSLTPRLRGPDRRRLMDLGFLPGTPVQTELISPGGDPIAYQVRGTLIALRGEQAKEIIIDLESKDPQ